MKLDRIIPFSLITITLQIKFLHVYTHKILHFPSQLQNHVPHTYMRINITLILDCDHISNQWGLN